MTGQTTLRIRYPEIGSERTIPMPPEFNISAEGLSQEELGQLLAQYMGDHAPYRSTDHAKSCYRHASRSIRQIAGFPKRFAGLAFEVMARIPPGWDEGIRTVNCFLRRTSGD